MNDSLDKILSDMKQYDPEIIKVEKEFSGNVYIHRFGSSYKKYWLEMPIDFRDKFRERLIKQGF